MSEKDKQDNIKCIKHTHRELKDYSWCGRYVNVEFCFNSIDTAIYSMKNQGNLIPCPECVEKILELL